MCPEGPGLAVHVRGESALISHAPQRTAEYAPLQLGGERLADHVARGAQDGDAADAQIRVARASI